MSKQQTAVNFLIHSINEDMFQLSKSEAEWKEIFKKAKEMEQTNSIESLIERNYNAQIRRGQNLTPIACLAKINEEVEEYNKEWAYVNNEEAQQKELSDIILSCFTKAKVMGWDIMEVLSDKVAYNEKRED